MGRQTNDEASNWQILLIGGCSGVGKTVIANTLAKSLQVTHMLVDDVRIAIQATTTPTQLPDLHYFLTLGDPSKLSASEFTDGLVRVGTAMIPALRTIISHHLIVPETGRLIIEGDGVLPALSMCMYLADLQGLSVVIAPHQIRSVFLVENDEEALLQNFIARDRGFNQATNEQGRRYVHSVWQFGQLIKTEAMRYGVPVVEVRPYDSLAQRILEVIGR